jgi:uncharacterized protein YndB with AHSA1/START domain
VADDYGKVLIEGETGTLLFERWLRHPPERVWRALTEPAEIRQWSIGEVKIDGRLGGSYEAVTGPAQFAWTGRILVWEPHSTLEYESNTPPHEHLPQGERTIVRYELEARDGGTLLRLRHSRLTRSTALGFAPGTHAILDRLSAHLDGTPLPAWMRRYEEVKVGYPQWEAPLGKERTAASASRK